MPRWPRSGTDGDPEVRGYRLIRLLGQGGFSLVYEAEDLAHRRKVALKVARRRNSDAVRRFRLEADLGRQLSGTAGLVTALSQVQTTDRRPALVLPLYDRGSLAVTSEPHARISQPVVLQAVRQVGQGLAAMHARHYLHRDVSPRNVLSSSELGYALADLGCARPVNSLLEPAATTALTPGFCAPEALSLDTVQTVASDVYALAATTWALLTGGPPHGQVPAGDVRLDRYEAARATRRPDPDALLAVRAPQAAIDVLLQALDPDPTARPASVKDFLAALATAGPHPVSDTTSQQTAEQASTPRAGSIPEWSVGPRTPPPPADAEGGQTRLAGAAEPAEQSQNRRRPRRRGLPRSRAVWAGAALLVCFGLGYTAVRLTTGGPDQTPHDEPTATRSTAPAGPTGLHVVRTSGRAVTFGWDAPPPGALVGLMRSRAQGRWEVVTAPGTDTTAVVEDGRGDSPTCYRLIMVRGSGPDQHGDEVCVPGA